MSMSMSMYNIGCLSRLNSGGQLVCSQIYIPPKIIELVSER